MYNEDFSPCHWLAAAASSHLHHGNSVWIVSLEASSIIGSGVSVLSLSLSLSQGSNIQWYQQQFRRVHDGSSLYWTSVSTLIIQSFESSVAARYMCGVCGVPLPRHYYLSIAVPWKRFFQVQRLLHLISGKTFFIYLSIAMHILPHPPAAAYKGSVNLSPSSMLVLKATMTWWNSFL